MRRNEVMLDAFRRARVYASADKKFVVRLIEALERNSKPRQKRPYPESK